MASAGIGHKVEGIHSVAAALEAGRVRRLYVEGRRARSGAVAELVGRAEEVGVPVKLVPDVREFADTHAPQGVVAECDPAPTVSVDELAERVGAAIVVVDHAEDPHNVGAIARSAAAAGMTGMIVADVRAAPLQATAFKASAGALERLPVAVVSSIPQALKRLADRGVWVVGLDAAGSSSLFAQPLFTEPVAVVIGAEGTGLSELVRKRCDVIVSIPMDPAAESLNASVAAALACFEIRRVRHLDSP